MIDILVATIWTALVLFLLYETSAVFSYLKMLRPLNFLTKIKEYLEARSNGFDASYSDYMTTYHDGFWVRMFACRYCFGFWIALLFSAVVASLWAMPIAYFGGHLLCSGFKLMNDWMVNHG